MTKRVRDGSITLDDYDAQSLEVPRQVTGLFMTRIDHLIRDDYASNPLLNDLVIDRDDELGVNSAARDSDRSNSSDCYTHAMVNVRSREFPKSVLQADTIIVSCGLANFERTSWSTHRRHEFWWFYEELDTADYDKFVGSFQDNFPGMCIKFDDPGSDKSLRNHIGRNPRIMKSTMESKNYHELQRRLYYRMPRFFSRKNIVIMICRSGRHRSVENAELWSNTLARYSRHQHSVSLLHLSGTGFLEKNVCGKMFGMQ